MIGPIFARIMSTQNTTSPSSIYRQQNEQIRILFNQADSPRKVLCIALDYAKHKHVALICDGNGEILKKAFPVINSVEGLAFLIEQVSATARRRSIPKTQIFFGGEDEPSYVSNFLSGLRASGYLVVRVNAGHAKANRENSLASTDALDLIGIAKTLISRRARLVVDQGAVLDGALIQMRDLTRARRSMVRQKTAASNRIHSLVDRLLPGFLEDSKSGIGPFTEASLALMKERFSAPEIARRHHPSLTAMLRRHRIRHPEAAAGKLIILAREALPPDPSRVASQQESLRAAVELYECLERNSKAHTREAAILLAQTPYAMLTSLRGIGFVLAAGTGSELGDPAKLGSTDALCGYAGIVPRVWQSGGPDKAPVTGPTSRRCNRVLKDWAVQGAQKMALYGPPEIKERFARWKAAGQHAAFAGARRYLRLTRGLVRDQIPYLNPQARRANASQEEIAAACEETFEVMVAKWRLLPDWQRIAFAEDRPLGFWRRLAIETHGAHLPLPDES